MRIGLCGLLRRCLTMALAGALAAVPMIGNAAAGPYLLVDLKSGEVIAENQSFDPWYPASITKLMTTYVTLKAVSSGEIYGDTGVPMTAAAAKQPPSKMGFKPGTVITIDTALKIIMVKSANDVAMALGERVGGSLPAFVARMNAQALALGMTGTHFDNANGLPSPGQYTTARDYAILARALLREFPAYRDLYRITALSLGGKVIANHNNLLERYPGADGMKTGFICAAGFNVVASASRNGRQVLAVVLGGETAKARDELAAKLFEYAFQTPNSHSGITLDSLRPRSAVASAPADMHDLACPKKRNKKVVSEDLGDDDDAVGDAGKGGSFLVPRFKVMDPIPISIGGARDMPAAAVATPTVAVSSRDLTMASADLPPLPLPNPLRSGKLRGAATR
jgi:D-alanyl-D-alanine carboxypeptidase